MRSAIMAFIFLQVFACCALASENKVSDSQQTTELWEGKALTAKFRLGICYSRNGNAQGVLLLRHRNGNEDVYHLYGTLKEDEFYLTHSSGHRLQGRLTGPESMEGKAKLSSGLSMSLSGKRKRNVPLAAEDCAPLPEGASQ